MVRYLIFRHGEAETIGPDETRPLTMRGREQAACLGRRLSSFNASVFITSPLLRARQTAETVNKYLNLDLQIDERLREVGSYRMFYEIASGEGYQRRNTLGDFNRTQLKLIEFIKDVSVQHDGKTILISAHGNIIQALLAITIGITDIDALNRLIVANTGLTVLEWLKDDNYQLVVFNDTNHLGELMFR
ncbi:histidine phosphatase family protein [Patescibacteria group bacterium]|nr:histidine phosphatase family protein [Patescibacteria group bacterium]